MQKFALLLKISKIWDTWYSNWVSKRFNHGSDDIDEWKQNLIVKENDEGYFYIGKYSKKEKFQLVNKDTGMLGGVLKNLKNKQRL